MADESPTLYCPHCRHAIAAADLRETAVCPSCGEDLDRTVLLQQSGESQDTLSLTPHTTADWPGGVAAKERAETPADPQFIGHFKLLEILGRGAFGSVWKALDTKLDRLVAVKVPRYGELTPEEKERFFREAKSAAQLNHPHIVSVHEVGQQGETVYIVSDFVDGMSLAERLAKGMPPRQQAVELAVKIADALQHAHDHGVVHRDLKPANILLDRQGEPYISDFGLAKRETVDATMTAEGGILGTPAYMSPEQAAGQGHHVDGRADVYSLGVILYELLTGEVPFRGAVRMLLHQVMHEEPRSPRRLNDAVPRDLETIALKCLEKEPGRRMQTAAEVADELRRFQSGEPIRTRPLGRLARAWRWCRRKPAVASLSAIVVLLLLALGGGGAAAALIQSHLRHEAEDAQGKAEVERGRAEVERAAAETARGKAEFSEEQARQRLAENLLQTARLAARQGRWRSALKYLDDALNSQHPDPVGVRLLQARAYNALSEVPRSTGLINELAALEDQGGHEAEILLWQGDIQLAQAEEQKAVDLLEKALKLGLPEAEAAYASALVAATSPEAERHLRETLRLDPFHPQANVQFVVTLIFLGKREEARLHAEVARRLFTDDPRFPLAAACVAALENDAKEVDRQLAQLGGQIDKKTRKDFRDIMQVISDIAGWFDHWDEGENLRIYTLLARAGATLGRIAPQLLGVKKTAAKLPDNVPAAAGQAALWFRAPPAISKGYRPLLPILAASVFKKDLSEEIAALDKAAHVHPDGTLHFLRASMMIVNGRWKEAETVFAQAAQSPAFFPGTRREALFGAALAAGMVSVQHKQPQALERSVAFIRQRVELGPLRPVHAGYLVRISKKAKAYDLARRIIHDYLRLHGDEIGMFRSLAEIELAEAEYYRALRAAEKALALEPKDQFALKYRDEAMEKLREAVNPSK